MSLRQEVDEKSDARILLNRKSITESAIQFIEEHGVERLSMRALANTLGCGTMSLYTHVTNRDDLLNSIIEELVARSGIPRVAQQQFERWQDLASGIHLAYRDLAVRHPRSFELLALAPYDTMPVEPYLEGLVDALARIGLTHEQAYILMSALDAYSTGFLTVWARTVSRSTHPNSQPPSELVTMRSLDHFEHGLQAFILGFEVEFSAK